MPDLEFTGERVIPGLVDPNLFNEHLARYRFAAQFESGASRVLDAGCGSGYGTAELSRATTVIAMDISADAIAHARAEFPAPNVKFLQASCQWLPFADASFDLITAFEVIEHLAQWEHFLGEARRVLKPAGVLLVSTPNKAWYAESRAGAGPNPYHVHEFEYGEFDAALRTEFQHVRLWSQNHCETIAFVSSTSGTGILDGVPDAKPGQAHFFLAACSQSPIAATRAFGWLPTSGNVLRDRQNHIALLEAEVQKKNAWLTDSQRARAALQASHDTLQLQLERSNQWAAQRDLDIEKARAGIEQLREEFNSTRVGYEEQIANLESDAQVRLQWVQDLEARIASGNAEIERLRVEIAERETLLAVRTEWAHSLDTQLQNERGVYYALEEQHGRTQQELLQTRQQLTECRSELDRATAEITALEASRWVRLGRAVNLLQPGDSSK